MSVKQIMRFVWWGLPPPDCLPDVSGKLRGPGGGLFLRKEREPFATLGSWRDSSRNFAGSFHPANSNKKPLSDIRQRTNSFLPCSGMLILEKETFFRQINVDHYKKDQQLSVTA